NLVLAPANVKFSLSVNDNPAITKVVPAQQGAAWVRMPSSNKEGAAQFVASLEAGEPVRRVVRQVASDACNLHFHIQRTEKAIEAETDPIRDCSGNAVPDGTIVTFIQTGPDGRSTVDARIKKGLAKAELPLANAGVIGVAA